MKQLSIKSKEDGFTLIEAMVAFTILAIIAGIAFTVVFGTSKRSRVLVREMELRRVGGSVINLISEDLKGAFVREGIIPFFVGSDNFFRDDPADEANFITTSTLPVNPMSPGSDVAETGYLLSFDQEGKGVLFRREQSPAQPPDEEGGVTREVSSLVRSFNLRYYDGDDWLDEWDSLDSGKAKTYGKIPREIEIEMTLVSEGSSITVKTRVAPPMALSNN